MSTVTIKPHTDELAGQPRTNAAANKRDALQMLDALEEYQYSKTSMVDELVFNFGYTPSQAEDVYSDWAKQVE